MHIKKGDTVKILAGKDRSKTGKVLAVLPDRDRATVEGRNLYFRHERPRRAGAKGQKIQLPMPIQISNLMLVCSHCGQPTRAQKTMDEKGLKARVCKKCRKRI